MQLCDEVAFEGCAMEEEARIEGVQGGGLGEGPGGGDKLSQALWTPSREDQHTTCRVT